MAQGGTETAAAPARSVESPAAIFLVFLRLGLTSFGGPVAHLAYFRHAFVTQRRWLSEAGYGDLVALCQFIPGPASSQVGFALGVLRGNGLTGGLAAWLGFTLPSALLLLACALGAAAFHGPAAAGILHGLKLVAVAVVAHATLGMARSLAPDRARAGIALAALAIVTFLGGASGQVAAILCGALAELTLCRGVAPATGGRLAFPVPARAGIAALALFALLLAGAPLLAVAGGHQATLFDAFYRAGALVFGGGHVVLPLLQAETVATGWVPQASFLAGYGMAQAVPGPLFAFASYLGAASSIASSPAGGAALATAAIFLPGLLLVYGMLPFWDRWRLHPRAQYAMRGANAAVVGILGAALVDPVWTAAVFDARDVALALAGFLLLTAGKAAPWIVVALLALGGALLGIS